MAYNLTGGIMSILNKLKEDIKKKSIQNEIDELREILNKYMVKLNKVLNENSKMSFDYAGGDFHNYGYFDFKDGYLFHIDTSEKLVSVLMFGTSFGLEFKWHRKTQSLTYWNHSISKESAKSDAVDLVYKIGKYIEELDG